MSSVLIGERGREVQEFIEDDLGEEGLKRAPSLWWRLRMRWPLMRRQAAYLTLALAEYFRGEGKQVLVHDGFSHKICTGSARNRFGSW